jgi:uncharacterized protein YecT (DUF1311 family)
MFMPSLHDLPKKTLMAGAAALVLLSGVAVLAPATQALGQQHGTHAPSASPQIPVVTEPTGPSPCNQQTQIGLDGCASQKVAAADKLLNADIKVVWNFLQPSARTDFVNAQATWVKYRRADCISQSDVYQGGSAQPMEYLLCLTGDDALRRQDLKGFYGLLTQGRSAPKFP